MLQRFLKRLKWPIEKRRRFYNRYLWWCSGRLSRHGTGPYNPNGLVEQRDMQLAIDRYNEKDEV